MRMAGMHASLSIVICRQAEVHGGHYHCCFNVCTEGTAYVRLRGRTASDHQRVYPRTGMLGAHACTQPNYCGAMANMQTSLVQGSGPRAQTATAYASAALHGGAHRACAAPHLLRSGAPQ